MNFLSRKIGAFLFAVMLGINLFSPAVAAVGRCVSPSCLRCDEMTITLNEPSPVFDPGGYMCDVSFANTPCNMKRMSSSNAQIFVVSSIKQYRKKIGAPFTFSIDETSFLQSLGKNRATGQFRVTANAIPIYLQNLSLRC